MSSNLATQARRTADMRRTLLNLYSGPNGQSMALSLMSLSHPTPGQQQMAQIIADTYRTGLANALLFLADPDMTSLLDTAGPTMPDQELQVTDIITPSGFVRFQEPLPDRSGDGPPIPIRALGWMTVAPDHPILDERDPDAETVLITSYVNFAEMLAAYEGRPVTLAEGAPALVPNASVAWTVGSLIGEVYGQAPEHIQATVPGFYQRAIAAFWTLAQQPKIIDSTPMPPGKPTDQRRSRRAGVIDPTAPVHVVRLHRTLRDAGSQSGETGTGRKVGVRFMVRGHWRRQWYSTIQSHRHIFISPFLKGPDDAPLRGGERVFLAKSPARDTPSAPRD